MAVAFLSSQVDSLGLVISLCIVNCRPGRMGGLTQTRPDLTRVGFILGGFFNNPLVPKRVWGWFWRVFQKPVGVQHWFQLLNPLLKACLVDVSSASFFFWITVTYYALYGWW